MTNYVEISITVLRPVQIVDSMASALLRVPAGLCMTRGRIVWFVCSGWGALAVVDGAAVSRASVSSLRTGVSTVLRCDWWYRRVESFLKFHVTKCRWRATNPENGCGYWPLDAAARRRSALGTLTNPSGELFDVIENFTTLGHLGQDFLLRVHHGGVVTTECLPDLGQRQVGQLTA
jgi:hypothetical protein